MQLVDEICEIKLVVNNETGKMVVRFKDNETGVEDEVSYDLIDSLMSKVPVEYYDNVAEFLIDKAKDVLIESKKERRYNPDFSKEAIQSN